MWVLSNPHSVCVSGVCRLGRWTADFILHPLRPRNTNTKHVEAGAACLLAPNRKQTEWMLLFVHKQITVEPQTAKACICVSRAKAAEQILWCVDVCLDVKSNLM